MAALAASSEGTGLNPMSFTDQHGSVGTFAYENITVNDSLRMHKGSSQVIVNCQQPKAFELLLNYMYSGCVVTKLKNYCAEYLD
ncbi:hypothetical protein TELCIR_23553, partial [Teladorsagia circumcincta]